MPEPEPTPPEPKKPDEGPKTFDQADVDRIVENRLSKERAKYADHAELKAKADKFDALEAENKSEAEKANEKTAAAEKRAAEADLRAARLEVAVEKKLSPAQAKRLVGNSKEELEADADAAIEDGTFKVDGGSGADPPKPPPTNKPKPDLKTGSDPTGDDADPDTKDLVDAIPRY